MPDYYAALPPTMRETLDAWAIDARPLGDCARAILAGDLFETFARADSETLAALPLIVKYVHNRLPAGCWGSHEKLSRWSAIKAQERHARAGEQRRAESTRR